MSGSLILFIFTLRMDNFTRQTLLQKIKDTHNEDSWNEFVAIYRPYIFVIIKNLGSAAYNDPIHRDRVLLPGDIKGHAGCDLPFPPYR